MLTVIFLAALLNVHRPYFAQALSDSPQDLLKHRYAPSVLAIYRSAWRLIEATRDTHKRVPFVVERYGLPWSFSIAAAVSSISKAWMHRTERDCC